MTDERIIDLEGAPDPNQEIRLESDNCIVSIWMPAPIEPMGRAIEALANAGFDVADTE